MTEEEKQRPFNKGSVVDDLIDWSKKLTALGRMVSAVSWLEYNLEAKLHTGSTELFFQHGEALGDIISDYASAVELALEENHRSWMGLEDKIVFDIKRPQEVLIWLKNGGFHNLTEMRCIEYQLEELDAFCINAALPAIELKGEYENFKKQFITRQKKAPTAVSAAAGA